jgi:hypothetical protein
VAIFLVLIEKQKYILVTYCSFFSLPIFLFALIFFCIGYSLITQIVNNLCSARIDVIACIFQQMVGGEIGYSLYSGQYGNP